MYMLSLCFRLICSTENIGINMQSLWILSTNHLSAAARLFIGWPNSQWVILIETLKRTSFALRQCRARNNGRSTDTVWSEMAVDRTKFVMTRHFVRSNNSCTLQSPDFCKNIPNVVPKYARSLQCSKVLYIIDLQNKHLIASFNSRANRKLYKRLVNFYMNFWTSQQACQLRNKVLTKSREIDCKRKFTSTKFY